MDLLYSQSQKNHKYHIIVEAGISKSNDKNAECKKCYINKLLI